MRSILLALAFAISVSISGQAQQSPLLAPTGPYAVGRTLFNWVDESRVDLLSPKGYREIPVWVWYPASPASDAQKAEWLPGTWGDIFAAIIAPRPTPGQPASQSEKYPIATIRSHSYADAPVSADQKKYPILVFAPGYGSGPTEYASVIEDVVSHGYIVAGIVPTYFSLYTVFSDGRVVGQYQSARDVPGAPRSSSDRGPVSEPVYRLWTGDIRFALNQLEKLNADPKSPLKGRFDFDRVGAFGHSIGATATAQVAKDDPRVRAAILIDGSIMGDVASNPIVSKPLFLILASSFKGRDRATWPNRAISAEAHALLRNAKPSTVITIAGTTHSFPADTGLMPFAKDWQGQSANPSRAMTITRAYIKAFFDQHLLGKDSSLLNGQSPEYPEVTLENAIERK
jgi:pimeloyl-ACP methyl ester carboxylesterase